MIVYVETNWLVACVLPHDEWGSDARTLLQDHETGLCELRIPEVSFLEARHVVEEKTKQHAKAVADTSANLRHAASNLKPGDPRRDELRQLAHNLTSLEPTYRLENPQKALAKLSEQCRGFAFSNAKQEQRILDELRGSVTLRGHDIVDLHVLAAVAADREANSEPKAAFLSTNSHEFAVTGASAKVPRDFYAKRRLVYLATFQLSTAQNRWDAAEGDGWTAPSAPQDDSRVQEAQRLLRALATDKRDEALRSLQALHAR
jgi:hypothetical protein